MDSATLADLPEAEAKELFHTRLCQCIVHRILYYCFNVNMISDQQYDTWERELIDLTGAFPQVAEAHGYSKFNPALVVGSSDTKSYPPKLVRAAESLVRSYIHTQGE